MVLCYGFPLESGSGLLKVVSSGRNFKLALLSAGFRVSVKLNRCRRSYGLLTAVHEPTAGWEKFCNIMANVLGCGKTNNDRDDYDADS